MESKSQSINPDSIFIFRRDLRIHDNTALLSALQHCRAEDSRLALIFVFNIKQIDSSYNRFYSSLCFGFMVACLLYLRQQLRGKGLRLQVFLGDEKDVWDDISKKNDFGHIFENRDVTLFSHRRSAHLSKLAKLNQSDDYSLVPIGEVLNGSGHPYQKFTPFFENWKHQRKAVPQTYHLAAKQMLLKSKYETTIEDIIKKTKVDIDKLKSDYEDVQAFARKLWSDESNSHFIKYGVVSSREFYKAHKNKAKIVENLAWRDLSYQLFFQRDLQDDVLPCKYGQKPLTQIFHKMLHQHIGIPIVDATIIQLKETGIINNRQRLMIGYFIVKELRMDWRIGAQLFAKTLKDYDPSINNFNWQWIASDFKHQNVWRQSGLIDKDCKIIKKYIPALKDVPSIDIHKWDERYDKYDRKSVNYPEPQI